MDLFEGEAAELLAQLLKVMVLVALDWARAAVAKSAMAARVNCMVAVGGEE